MRATARLDSDDAFGGERLMTREKLRVFLRVNVVGDHGNAIPGAELLTEPEHQHRLAGSDRPADADAHST